MSSPSYAQSDIDSEQQLIYTYFYSKQPEEAKKIIDTAFLTSSKDSKNNRLCIFSGLLFIFRQ